MGKTKEGYGSDPGSMHKHYAKKLGDNVSTDKSRSHQSMKAHTVSPAGQLFGTPDEMRPLETRKAGYPQGMGFNQGQPYAGAVKNPYAKSAGVSGFYSRAMKAGNTED